MNDLYPHSVGFQFVESFLNRLNGALNIRFDNQIQFVDFAFNDLGLDRIISLANVENVASTALMKKLGLSYEKEIHIYDENAVYYALNKSDWLKQNS